MNIHELDILLRTKTRRELYYLEHPGITSPSYQDMQRKVVNGREVLYFKLPALKEAEILIRKDSRFTDVPYFVHSNLNMNYIYSGKCDFQIDDRSITLHQGDVAVFDQDVVRRKLYSNEQDIIVNISMSNEFFSDSFLRRIGNQSLISNFMLHVLSEHSGSHDHYMVFRSSKNPLISSLFQQLLLEYYSERVYGKDMIRGYLHLIFTELLRLYNEYPKEQMIRISADSGETVIHMLQYIEEHYQDCSLNQLAQEFCYHPKYATSLLKKLTGSSFKEIQIQERLKKAAELLLETEESIQSICEQVGISNQSFFYRCFKNIYRMSPKEYRQRKKGG